jgi:transposase
MGTYSQEFKDQVVELHRRDGRTFMDLGKEFNLSPTTVANWSRSADKRDAAKRLAQSKKAVPQDEVESDKAKIARLERELARKSEELEILGKALAFFVRRTDR